jgi:hypothetical protein
MISKKVLSCVIGFGWVEDLVEVLSELGIIEDGFGLLYLLALGVSAGEVVFTKYLLKCRFLLGEIVEVFLHAFDFASSAFVGEAVGLLH